MKLPRRFIPGEYPGNEVAAQSHLKYSIFRYIMKLPLKFLKSCERREGEGYIFIPILLKYSYIRILNNFYSISTYPIFNTHP